MNIRRLFYFRSRLVGFCLGLALFSLFAWYLQMPRQPAVEESPMPMICQPSAEFRRPITLIEAVWSNKVETVKRLLDSGVDVDSSDDVSPLAHAVSWNIIEEPRPSADQINRRVAIVTLLIQHGANLNVGDEDNQRTPLRFAIEANSLALVKALLAKGVNSDYSDTNGYTPLLCAITDNKDISIVRLLLAHGSYPNVGRRHRGASALMIAADEGREDIALALLKAGADVNAWDYDGDTVIERAVKNHDSARIVRLLKRWRARRIHIKPQKDGPSGSAWDQ